MLCCQCPSDLIMDFVLSDSEWYSPSQRQRGHICWFPPTFVTASKSAVCAEGKWQSVKACCSHYVKRWYSPKVFRHMHGRLSSEPSPLFFHDSESDSQHTHTHTREMNVWSCEGFQALPVPIACCVKLSQGQEGNSLSHSEYFNTKNKIFIP